MTTSPDITATALTAAASFVLHHDLAAAYVTVTRTGLASVQTDEVERLAAACESEVAHHEHDGKAWIATTVDHLGFRIDVYGCFTPVPVAVSA